MSDKDLEIKQQIRFSTPADPNQESATPVPAATVLLVREGETTPEVFMIQRALIINLKEK